MLGNGQAALGVLSGRRLTISDMKADDVDTAASTEWDDIVAEHSARVYRLAYRLTGNPHDAADLTQDVFVRAWQKPSTGELVTVRLYQFASPEGARSYADKVITAMIAARRRRLGDGTEVDEDCTRRRSLDLLTMLSRPSGALVELDVRMVWLICVMHERAPVATR